MANCRMVKDCGLGIVDCGLWVAGVSAGRRVGVIEFRATNGIWGCRESLDRWRSRDWAFVTVFSFSFVLSITGIGGLGLGLQGTGCGVQSGYMGVGLSGDVGPLAGWQLGVLLLWGVHRISELHGNTRFCLNATVQVRLQTAVMCCPTYVSSGGY